MSFTNWTPGPWQIEMLYPDMKAGITSEGFDVVSTTEGVDPIRNIGDAHLISAAPELHYALKAVINYIPCGVVYCQGDKCREPWCGSCNPEEEAEEAIEKAVRDLQMARIALAKARGEDQ